MELAELHLRLDNFELAFAVFDLAMHLRQILRVMVVARNDQVDGIVETDVLCVGDEFEVAVDLGLQPGHKLYLI